MQKDVDGAQIHIQCKRHRVLRNCLCVEMHVQDRGAADGGFDEGVVTIPEAVALGICGEDPDVLVALARESDHQDDTCVM